MPETGQTPYCLAMVLCDAVHQDPTTGKFTILGTFTRLIGKKIRIKTRLCVYFAITDGLGKRTITLRIADSEAIIENVDPLIRIEAQIEFGDPLAVVEAVFGFEMEFPKPGVYHCELVAGDDVLMSRRLVVAARNGEGEDHE